MVVLITCLVIVVPAAGATSGRVCGFVRASVPYSRNGSASRWRVYASGATTCGTAQSTLDAVMHLRASQHPGPDEADSFSAYRGWICPFGQMGVQLCSLPGDSPSRPRASALAVQCSTNRCPSARPPAYFR
jgi:hypothetical protein